jgi:hypothetical protein
MSLGKLLDQRKRCLHFIKELIAATGTSGLVPSGSTEEFLASARQEP